RPLVAYAAERHVREREARKRCAFEVVLEEAIERRAAAPRDRRKELAHGAEALARRAEGVDRVDELIGADAILQVGNERPQFPLSDPLASDQLHDRRLRTDAG